MIEEKVNKLIEVARAIQKEGVYYVFVHYYGHTNEIDIEVSELPNYKNKLYSKHVYLSPETFSQGEEYITDYIDEMLVELWGFLDD